MHLQQNMSFPFGMHSSGAKLVPALEPSFRSIATKRGVVNMGSERMQGGDTGISKKADF